MTAPRRVYFDVARELIAAAGIEEQLATRPAVILESHARAAGSTRWFFCRNLEQLPRVVSLLGPWSFGSKVSFFFDDRIQRKPWTPATRAEIVALIEKHGEILVATLDRHQQKFTPPDQIIDLEADFPETQAQFVAEVEPQLRSHEKVFFGEYPGRDDDGVNVFTVVLPDADGIVRSHPY